MTATLDRPMSAKTVRGSHWHPSEEAMYLAVTLAWFGLVDREQRRQHPLEPYVFGWRFVRSVISGPVEPRVVALACAKLACRYPGEKGAAEPMPLPSPPAAAGDPLSTWWRACEGPDELGVHYDELVGGTLEFLSVGSWRERPPQGFRHR
jgi:hypothetical protein